ncbi:MAG: aldehyde dehydrogenase family protein [Candidatus Aminicenantales bacterium]
MVDSLYQTYADEILNRAAKAARLFETYNQKAVDHIVRAVFVAAFNARLDLARLAHEETGIGIFKHKVIKNVWASLLVYENIKDQKTVGEISHNPYTGITEIAQPHGPILALTPLTNPTSTAIFKVLIAMKTRNPLIFSPHGSARKCTLAAAEILYEAARKAGAPEYCIQWVSKQHPEYLQKIMRHRDLTLILATGTRQIVKEAYASGKPVIGIGPGNVPVFVDSSADYGLAAEYIVLSKTFDNGTVCASEQALVVEKKVDRVLKPFLERQGCYFCSPAEAEKLGEIAFDSVNRIMRADAVGRPAHVLAERAGFSIPERAKLLIAPCEGVGTGYPLSYEILTPILAYYVVEDYDQAFETCIKLNELGGQGHTVSIYTNEEKVIQDFSIRISAGRICVNTPATHGAIGGMYNALNPSFTLSCGTHAGNIFTDNITTTHLLNIRRVARRRPNLRWFTIQEHEWLESGVTAEEMFHRFNMNF